MADPIRDAAAQPPAPVTPLDLDALLSPQGAYEPGTGEEEGAQQLTGRHGELEEWWMPMYGSDSLDNLLYRIRARILPYLRPPIAGIDVPGGDGDYGGLQELCEAEGVDVRIGAPLLKRAREAWKVATQPPAPVPAPAAVPVAVSERPLLKKDPFNDALGRCWCGTNGFTDNRGDLPVEYPTSWELREPCPEDDSLLPANALPLPIPQPPQGGEVAK